MLAGERLLEGFLDGLFLGALPRGWGELALLGCLLPLVAGEIFLEDSIPLPPSPISATMFRLFVFEREITIVLNMRQMFQTLCNTFIGIKISIDALKMYENYMSVQLSLFHKLLFVC